MTVAHTPARRSLLAAAALVSLALAVCGGAGAGCKKEEPGPPMPQTPEVSAAPTTVVLSPPVEDASDDATDARAAAVAKPYDPSGLRACCAALAQNGASMPPPNNLYAANAAAYCNAGVASVTTTAQRDALFAGLRSAMRGAAMPAACQK